MIQTLSAASMLAAMLALTASGNAQISLTSAVDLALRSSPKLKMAQDDLAKAQAQLAETHDVYIPSINAGAGLGQAYGYSQYPPTLFNINAGSLVYNSAQKSYIRSARAGVSAAELALADMRLAVAQDTALAWLALDHDQKRQAVLMQQAGFAHRLVEIVQERADAGQDSQISLTQAKITEADLRVALIRGRTDLATDRDHLARLIDLPPTALTAADAFPGAPLPTAQNASASGGYATPGVASAFASAEAKRLQANGEAHFRFRPQISFVATYNRYATFTESFKSIDELYGKDGVSPLTANEAAFGVQITVPVLDRNRAAKATETAADAAHALHEAQNSQLETLDSQSRLRNTLELLQAESDDASLKQQLAQQQLDIVRLQLQAANPDGPQTSPKDEQNALISERDKYLSVIDADFQLHQAEIQLLRATGQLDTWLRSAAAQKP